MYDNVITEFRAAVIRTESLWADYDHAQRNDGHGTINAIRAQLTQAILTEDGIRTCLDLIATAAAPAAPN
jgi:hypothetical protein